MRKILLFIVVITTPLFTVQAQTAAGGNIFFQNESTLKWLLKTDQAYLDHNASKADSPIFKSEAERLAKSDNPEAKARLGYLYYRGLGVNESIYQSEKLLMEAEAAGNLFAKFSLANLYTENKTYHSPYGIGTTQDYDKALELMRSSAEAGFPPAEYFLGMFYARGFIVEKDGDTALSWVKKASDKGYVMAQVELANFYIQQAQRIKFNLEHAKRRPQTEEMKNKIARLEWEEKGNYEKALQLYKNAADYGYWEANYLLGNIYFDSELVEPSNETAMSWYRKAADKGYSGGYYGLYRTSMAASGVKGSSLKNIHLYKPENDLQEAAINYLEKAAEKKFPPAMLLVADRYSSLYSNKASNSFDQEKVEKANQYANWYIFETEGAAMGIENQYLLAEIYERTGAYDKAIKWCKKTIETSRDYSGRADHLAKRCYLDLGEMYLEGKGVNRNPTEANQYFKRYIGGAGDDPDVVDVMRIQRRYYKFDDPEWQYIGEDEKGIKFYYHPESVIKLGFEKDYVVLVKKIYKVTDDWVNKGFTSTPATIRGHAYSTNRSTQNPYFIGTDNRNQETLPFYKVDSKLDTYEKRGTEFKHKDEDIDLRASTNFYSYPILEKLTERLF